MAFTRLIRFVDEQDHISYGDLQSEWSETKTIGSEVQILDGNLQSGFTRTDRKAKIKTLLSPLPTAHIIICIGINYVQHAKEANINIPPYPVVFTKPPDSLSGPQDTISIHPSAQGMLDYEGELAVVIGKDVKDVSETDALDCVLGYSVANDISARNFQLPETSGGQYCYAKSFDGFAPIGPCIVSPSLIPDPQSLHLTTLVNGELRQETSTDDMIWSIRQIISHLSRGTTLRKGTIVLTGTPSGVGLFMTPKGFLASGDVVEVNVNCIGSVVNRVLF